jgi:septal ring factor EnvC (AmiA/AmiB activator)
MSLVDAEKDAHEMTREVLEETEMALKKMELDKVSLEDDLSREKEARTSVEDMLQDYKEEVDTLNEALKIAARGNDEALHSKFNISVFKRRDQ